MCVVIFSFDEIMMNCWIKVPSKRPSFSELVKTISAALVEIADYLVLSPSANDHKDENGTTNGTIIDIATTVLSNSQMTSYIDDSRIVPNDNTNVESGKEQTRLLDD